MPAQTQKSTPPSEAVSRALDVFTSGFGANFDSLMKANAEAGQKWMENCSRISRELMEFTNDRWGKDVESFRQLSECRDPFQAFQLQVDAMQAAMKQYMEEATKLADMATDAGVSCFKSIDEGMRNATTANGSDTPRKAV